MDGVFVQKMFQCSSRETSENEGISNNSSRLKCNYCVISLPQEMEVAKAWSSRWANVTLARSLSQVDQHTENFD